MPNLNKMIEKLCPNGVEYKHIKDICIVLKKGTLKTTDLLESGYPVINSGRSLYGYYDKYNNDGNAFTVAARGEYAGYINYFSNKFWAGGLCYPYRSKSEQQFNTKFIYYCLKNIEKTIRKEIVADGSIPALNKGDLELISIPIPPIEVQEEIVRILDKLSSIEELAQNEINEFQKKSDYYKRKMLSIKSDMCLIKNVAICQKTKNKDQQFNNAYSITQRGLIPTSEYFGEKTKITSSNTSNYYIVKKNWFVYSPSRIDVGSIGYHKSDEIAIVSPIDVVFSVDNKKIDNNYLLNFLLSANGMSQILFQRQGIEGTGRKNLPFDNFAKIEIPLPTIDEQKQIVYKINKFEKYINDILIPKKKLYQKQYEYYRNKLLSFEELSVSE